MKTFLTLKKQASTSEVLSVVAQAEEFREIRLKAGEKSLYREINRAGGIWFPIKVDLALPAHKISLLIQSELGAVDFPDSEQFQKHKFSFQQDKSFVFSHINRLIRCIIDCQITLADSVAVKNALDLARSFGAKVWDGSPLQIKQIDQVGVVTVRKLTAAGITSLEALEQTEPHRIDMILSKNPPFGMKLLGRLADFPKLRVSVKKTGRDINPGAPVKVRFKADVAFMNEKCPISFQRRPVYVCFLAETSDGRLIDFRRISASKLQSNHEITLTAEIKGPDQLIRCHVMCDDIEIQADLPPSLFPGRSSSGKTVVCQNQPTQMNISRQRSNNSSQSRMDISRKADTFDYDDFIFDDLLEMDILTNTPPPDIEVPKAHPNEKPTGDISGHDESEPTRLDNDKPPKASKKQSGAVSQKTDKFSQMTLSASVAKKKAPMTSSHGQQHTTNGSESLTTEQEQCPSLITFDPSSVSSDFGPGNDTSNPSVLNGDYSSDYGDDSLDDLPSPSALLLGMVVRTTSPDNGKSIRVSNAEEDMFIGDDWLFTDEPLHLTQAAPLAKSPQRSRGDGQRSVGGDKIEGSTKEALQKDALEPRNNIRDKNAQEHSDTAVLARALSLDDSGGTKRKLAATDPNQQSKDREGRPKRNKTETSTHNSSPHHQEDDDNATEQSNGGHPDRQYMDISGPSAMPADWEGIDPTLLNEFKDIIDFF
ncbi:hypothetical protein EYZ11_009640 [Aspergillus tanneri]|uniref:SEC63 domain-containing protein n=1 Tax=Aspergillus tanneri TaxID=1220188 RepID=A0A4S3JCS9_9EURO|nr:hypothetical protein EYZ11_009640 [Aspergillus tanneri]